MFGPGTDEPLVWYQGSYSYSPAAYLLADERGSIMAVVGSSGGINTYDEYGAPGANSCCRPVTAGASGLAPSSDIASSQPMVR